MEAGLGREKEENKGKRGMEGVMESGIEGGRERGSI